MKKNVLCLLAVSALTVTLNAGSTQEYIMAKHMSDTIGRSVAYKVNKGAIQKAEAEDEIRNDCSSQIADEYKELCIQEAFRSFSSRVR